MQFRLPANTYRNGLRLPPSFDTRNRTRRWGCQLFQGESKSAAVSVTLTLSQQGTQATNSRESQSRRVFDKARVR